MTNNYTSLKNHILALVILLIALPGCAQKFETENVILVTMDGYRWQELFMGIDSALLESDFTGGREALREKFWGDTEDVRVTKLNPFFVDLVKNEGILLGDRRIESLVDCTNNMWFSYPGYNEILFGKADDERITSNAKTPNPNVTFLEALNQKEDFSGKVAAFTSWDVFPYIINEERSGVYVNGGFRNADLENLTETEQFLNKIQPQTSSPWGGVRLDVFTHNYALEYIKSRKPRVTYIAYGETDDFAHNGNYTKYIESAKLTNDFLEEIWDYVQSDEFYKDKTTLIITTDHGRGTVPLETWRGHGTDIDGAGQIWIAAIGPDIDSKANLQGQFYQSQVAATVMKLLGFDWEHGLPLNILK